MARQKRNFIEINTELLEAAILGFNIKRREIEQQIAELRLIASNGASRSSLEALAKTKRKRSLAAVSRKKMAGAQRKRWAAVKKENPSAPSLRVSSKKSN